MLSKETLQKMNTAEIVSAVTSSCAKILAAIERAKIPDPKRVRFHGVDIHDLIPMDRDWTSEDEDRIERVSGHRISGGDMTGVWHEKREYTR